MTPAALIAWRQRLGLTKSEACRRLGCSRTALNQWEAGERRIPQYIALACAALAFGLSPEPPF